MSRLTLKQIEIIDMIIDGHRVKTVAEKLNVTIAEINKAKRVFKNQKVSDFK